MGVIHLRAVINIFSNVKITSRLVILDIKKIDVSTDLKGRKKLSADRTSAIKNDGLFVVCQSHNDTFKVTLSFDSL